MLFSNRSQRTSLLSTALFLAGLFFIANSRLNITGAAVGGTVDPQLNALAGLFFVFAAGAVYVGGGEDQRTEQRHNLDLFVKHHFKAYRVHLEGVGDKDILSQPEYLRDKRAKERLYELFESSKSEEAVRKKVKNVARELLDHNQIPETPREYVSIVKSMGGRVEEGTRHMLPYMEGQRVTDAGIPRSGPINRQRGKTILRRLAETAEAMEAA